MNRIIIQAVSALILLLIRHGSNLTTLPIMHTVGMYFGDLFLIYVATLIYDHFKPKTEPKP